MDAVERVVRVYRSPDRREPFTEWFSRLRDQQARQRITARITRIRAGNLGVTRSVGEGVLELKIDYGPGYRVYLGQDGQTLVILLCGGDKSTQRADIDRAKWLWEAYQQEKDNADR